jgi:hypothetical protein
MTDLDADYAMAVAELEAMQQFTREKCVAREVAAEQQSKRTARLEAWDRAGLGDHPLPEPGDDLIGMPLHLRARLEAHAPELARELLPAQPLPARLELKLSRGDLSAFEPEDVEHLLAANRGDVVEQLRQRHQEEMWATFEQGHAAVVDPERRAQEQAEMEARRLASEAQSNAAARGQWLAATNAGAPNPLVADAIRLGRL